MDQMDYEKMKPEQESTCNQAVAGCARDTVGYAQAAQVPLRLQLEREFNSNASRQRVVAQALDIITRHPEFEEFLLLQRIINHSY
jgi:hypothetical protein